MRAGLYDGQWQQFAHGNVLGLQNTSPHMPATAAWHERWTQESIRDAIGCRPGCDVQVQLQLDDAA
jgi:hypothetical protein